MAQSGTLEAITELDRLAVVHPDVPTIQLALNTAIEEARRRTWVPPTPPLVIQIAANESRRWVSSAADLRHVLVKSLERCEEEMQGKGDAQFLWDERPVKPKSESALSNWLQRHFEEDLHGRGIISGRELQVRPHPRGHMGEAIDLLVSAIAEERVEGAPIVMVSVEVKGCWHTDVLTALETQLVDRYLVPPESDQGIYVVGWYASELWDDTDSSRRRRCREHSRQQLVELLGTQATVVSSGRGVEVDAFVLDCSLPPRDGPARR